MSDASPFEIPPYPHDRLAPLAALGARLPGGLVDCSIGTPGDALPAVVRAALVAAVDSAVGYPPSVGDEAFRAAAARWLTRRFGVPADPEHVAACVGTKEFVADVPHLLRLRRPDRDTVLHPETAYPTYAMGARLAGCRAVPVAMDRHWRIDPDSIRAEDAERALCLWVNTPGNPAGGLDDLVAAAEWGRAHGVPVFSDECYIEFTWADTRVGGSTGTTPPGRSILEAGVEGVVAVHSLSKRSNFAGARVGFYTGDPEIVHHLAELRKHAGRMVPGPVQAAAAAAFDDDAHVDEQRGRYLERLVRLRRILARFGVDAPMPAGGFYLWARAPGDDAWALVERLVTEAGLLVSPGEFYGPAGSPYVRIAAVQPDDRLSLVEERIGAG